MKTRPRRRLQEALFMLLFYSLCADFNSFHLFKRDGFRLINGLIRNVWSAAEFASEKTNNGSWSALIVFGLQWSQQLPGHGWISARSRPYNVNGLVRTFFRYQVSKAWERTHWPSPCFPPADLAGTSILS